MKRTRLFRSLDDVPSNLPKEDEIVIYDRLQKKRTITEKSVSNTNFNDISKLDLAIGLMEKLDDVEKLKRELAETMVINKLLTKKLLEHGISSAFSPEEIKDFKVTIDVALRERINNVIEDDLTDIKKDIINRVQTKIAESYDEYQGNLEYELVRINNYLNMNDVQLVELNRSQLAKDKKSKSTKDIQDMSLKLINKKHELTDKFKKENPIENKKNDTVAQNGNSNFGFDLNNPIDYSKMGE